MSADLTPDEVRQLLRESVTVVKPGEVVFYTAGDPNITPNQLREIQQMIDRWLEANAPDVKVLVLPHGGMTVADPEPGFLKDCRIEQFRAGLNGPWPVRITHVPTGITADGLTKDEAIRKLGTSLAARGDISINDVRRALRLPKWDIAEFDTAQPVPQG